MGKNHEQGAYEDWVTIYRLGRALDSGLGTSPALALLRVALLKTLERRVRNSVENMGSFQKNAVD